MVIHLDIPIKKNLSGSKDRVLRPLNKTSLADHLRLGSVVHAGNLIGKSYIHRITNHALRGDCLQLQSELSEVQNNHPTIFTAESRYLLAEFLWKNIRSIHQEPK